VLPSPQGNQGTTPEVPRRYQYLQDVAARADLMNGWWWTLVLPDATQTANSAPINILDAVEVEDSNGDFLMYAGADDGMVYQLFDTSTKNFIDASGNSIAVTTIFQTRYVRPGNIIQVPTDTHGQGSSGRIDPRWIEVRRTGTVDSNWTFVIDTSDGPDTDVTPRDTTTVTVSFTDDETLKRVPISSTLTPAEWVRVKATNSESNVNDSILGIRLYYHIREGQFEV